MSWKELSLDGIRRFNNREGLAAGRQGGFYIMRLSGADCTRVASLLRWCLGDGNLEYCDPAGIESVDAKCVDNSVPQECSQFLRCGMDYRQHRTVIARQGKEGAIFAAECYIIVAVIANLYSVAIYRAQEPLIELCTDCAHNMLHLAKIDDISVGLGSRADQPDRNSVVVAMEPLTISVEGNEMCRAKLESLRANEHLGVCHRQGLGCVARMRNCKKSPTDFGLIMKTVIVRCS